MDLRAQAAPCALIWPKGAHGPVLGSELHDVHAGTEWWRGVLAVAGPVL
jgi:hypothetical protein